MTNPQAGRTFFQRIHAGEKHRQVMGIRYARDPSPPIQWLTTARLITTGLIKAVLLAAAGAVG